MLIIAKWSLIDSIFAWPGGGKASQLTSVAKCSCYGAYGAKALVSVINGAYVRSADCAWLVAGTPLCAAHSGFLRHMTARGGVLPLYTGTTERKPHSGFSCQLGPAGNQDSLCVRAYVVAWLLLWTTLFLYCGWYASEGCHVRVFLPVDLEASAVIGEVLG